MRIGEHDAERAWQTSTAARELDLTSDPSAVHTFQACIDASAHEAAPFWRALPGWAERDGPDDPADP